VNRPNNYPQEPKELWDRFYEITQVPRPSKKEEKIRDYLIKFAESSKLEYRTDHVGNVVIYVPASSGMEGHGPVIIQNHMDMVCDKTPEHEIDFEKDPLEIIEDNGWIAAKGTTLGADNGIGMAAALALVTTTEFKHPPLELLFTTDEETGLNGAIGLDSSLLEGRRMINMDTEEWGAIYIGCAGGIDYEFFGKCSLTRPDESLAAFKLEVKGLKGGHSGLDIHLGRGNAIKLLGEILWDIRDLNFELCDFNGGRAHNIIPRDATCVIRTEQKNHELLKDICNKKHQEFCEYLPLEDHNFEINLEAFEGLPSTVLIGKERDRIIGLINLCPHGARSYNWKSKWPLVNLSSNMAVLKLEGGELYLQTSARFFERHEMNHLEQQFEALSLLFKLDLKRGAGYPSWKPDFDNSLLDLSKNVYQEMFNEVPKVKAIHAGLECGLLKDKLGDMDIISIGPNITGAHSPTERLEIESTGKFFGFLATILGQL